MQEGDRGESDSREGERDKRTGDERSRCWCNIVTGNSTLPVGLVYRSPNISIEENEKVHNATKM